MPKENLRLTQLMQDASGRANSESASQGDIRHALTHSWSVLSTAGFNRFGGVVKSRPLDFAEHVRGTQPEMAKALSMALDTIGWYQFSQLEGAPDKAVQFLQRANLLAPHSSVILYHLSDSTLLLNDSHLGRIPDPDIRRATLHGYRRSTQDTILHTLNSTLNISESVIRGQSSTPIEACTERLSPENRDLAYNLLGKLAALCNISGTDRERLGLLNLSIGASSCQLALLGLGRDLNLIVADFIDRLGNCETNADVENFLQSKSPLVLNIFCQLGTTTWNKGKLLSAHIDHAPDPQTRALMKRDYHLMNCLSEDLDAILDLLEPMK